MKRLAVPLFCLLLQACSPSTKGLGQSFRQSLFGAPGVQLTDDDIALMPYASQYMQLNGGPQIFVALAFSENGQQKWLTQDRAMLVTQHGRLVKTQRMGDNLLTVDNLNNDPLAQPNHIVDGASWTRTLGWTEHQQVRYARATSTFRWSGSDTLTMADVDSTVRVLEETVTTPETSWHNRFWVDSDGQIRRSVQYLGAGFFPIATTLIKAAKS